MADDSHTGEEHSSLPALLKSGAALIFGFSHVGAHASTDLFSLSLDELLNVKVIVAEDRLEEEGSVFGSVDRIAESEWRRFGARLAFDALENASGIDTHLSIGGTTTLSIRGYADSTGSARGKALLYDGIPLNGYAFATDLYGKSLLASEMFGSIEIVKGPISNYYGPDAFHGAILFRPWESEYSSTQTQVSLGTDERLSANLRSHYELGSGLHGTTNFAYYSQDAAGPFAPSVGREYANRVASKSISQTIEYNSHRFGLLLNESKTEDFYDIFRTNSFSRINPSQSALLYYRSQIELPNGVLFKPSLWRNESSVALNFFSATRIEAWEDLTHGAKLHLEHEDGSRHWKVGIEYLNTKITESQSNASGSHTPAPYDGLSRGISSLLASQTNTYLDGRLDLKIGLRYDHFSNTSANEFSPKIGIIYRPNELNALKLVSASGYRAPAAGEIAGTNAFLGSDSMKGERLNSYELIHIFTSEKLTVNNTLFINQWKDAIVTRSTDASQAASRSGEFVNAGSNKSYGYELEATYLEEEINTLVFLNASYIRSKNLDTGEPFDLFPETKIAMGIRYKTEGWDLSLTSLHKIDRKRSPLPGESRLPDYHALNAAIAFKADTYSIDLSLRNLLDRTNIEPSLWSVPGGIYQTGTEARLSLRTEF